MGIVRNISGIKTAAPEQEHAAAFWNWFAAEAPRLHGILHTGENAEAGLQEIIDRLQLINPGFYALAGMSGSGEAELVITVDGFIHLIVFAEDLVAQAPAVPGWKFTALKPALGFDDMQIAMNGFEFDDDHVFFFTTPGPEQPDLIEIELVHTDYSEEAKDDIGNGLMIYLENALGELNFVTQIDQCSIAANAGGNDLIPIGKLPDYLTWREKEFIEKYDGARYHTSDDRYTAMQGADENDMPLIAIVNQQLLDWDAKASHPWMALVEITYEGNEQGMPGDAGYAMMDELENDITAVLTDAAGYLNIGRETYNHTRTIYIACKEFRHSSRTLHEVISRYQDRLNATYQIFKDKYWQTVDRFNG